MNTFASERLREWERTMRTGLAAARCGQARAAEGQYLRALSISRALLACLPVGEEAADDRAAAFVVTHLNLADLHAESDPRSHPALS